MIILKNIYKSYIGKHVRTDVLKDLSLEIKKSEFVAIMGKSGSGKSTLLNILGCMDRFDAGSYYFNDIDISKLSNKEIAGFRNENIGFIFQAFHLIHELTCLENIMMPMGIKGISLKERQKRAIELLKDVGLENKAQNRPAELSGGEQQRIAIARALANKPTVILADEPTGNLDEENGKIIINYLKDLNKREKVTIIMVTHDADIAGYADYVLKIRDGKIC